MTRSVVQFAPICIYRTRTVQLFTLVWESNCIFSLTKATAGILLVLIYLVFVPSPLKLLGFCSVMSMGWFCSMDGWKELSFPYSSLFHPIWSSFPPDWNEVGIATNFVSSSLLVNRPIMLFFTHFPSKLISHHTHIKQKCSLLPLILFVFLWTALFLVWISGETKRFIPSNFKYVEVRPDLVSSNPGKFSSLWRKMSISRGQLFHVCFRKIRHV